MFSGKDEVMMKKRVILAAIGMAMVMGLGGCGNSRAASEAVAEPIEASGDREEAKDAANEAAGDRADAGEAEEVTQMGNPFTDVSSISEAEEMTGFSITVPEAPAEYPDMYVRVMTGSMIEIIFENKANETEYAIDEGYRIRKEAGTEDISGDYNVYAEVTTVTVDGRAVTMKGNDGTVSVAVWTADEYSYAVIAGEHPMTAEEMTEVISSIF